MIAPVNGISLIINIIIAACGTISEGIHSLFPAKQPAESRPLVPETKKPMTVLVVLPMMIVFAVAGSCVSLYGLMLRTALRDTRNNFMVIGDMTQTCQEIPFRHAGTRRVVLRIDDVNAFNGTATVKRMTNDAIANGFPVVLGVVPKDIEYDINFVHLVRRQGCNTEVALQGIVAPADAHDQLTFDIYAAKNKLALITQRPITTYISNGRGSLRDLSLATKRNNLTTVSSARGGHYDVDATSAHSADSAAVPSERIIRTCSLQFTKGQSLCVIQLRAADFMDPTGRTDEEEYATYTDLLAKLTRSSFSVVTFEGLEGQNVAVR